MITKRSKKFIIPVVLFCLAAEFCFKIHLPYSISSAIIALPFMYAGFAFKSFEQKIDHIFGGCYLPFATILLFLSAFLIFKNDYVNLRTITVANPVLFYLSAIIAITGYLYISKSLEKTSSLFAIFFKKALVYIGENSIVYLCLNQIIISLIRRRVLDILENIALLIFVLIIISIIAYCINSSRILSAVFKGKF